MKTIDDLVSLIESRYPVGQATTNGLSVTGEPYVVIGSQDPRDGAPSIPGTIDEGKRGEFPADEETALWQARAAFQQYSDDRQGALYWRIRPTEVEGWKGKRGAMCYGVYMRLLISDKPVMEGSAS